MSYTNASQINTLPLSSSNGYNNGYNNGYSNNGSLSSLNALNNNFSNMSMQQAGMNGIPVPPPMSSQPLYSTTSSNYMQNSGFNLNSARNVTNPQPTQYVTNPQPTQYVTTTVQPLPVQQVLVPSTQVLVQPVAQVQPAQSQLPAGMLPAPINDGRRYARLTGQKGRSNRARNQLVQPLGQTGLATLPAGVPVEGLSGAGTGRRGGRRSRRSGYNNAGFNNGGYNNNGFNNGGLMQPGVVGQPMLSSAGSLPPGTSQVLFMPAQSQVQTGVPAGMLPAPINDGRRYARLTGQKGRSNRARNQLIQPLNNTGLATIPAGVPSDGLASGVGTGNNRRSRRLARRNQALGVNLGAQQPMMGSQPMLVSQQQPVLVSQQQPVLINQQPTTFASQPSFVKQEYVSVSQPVMGQAAF